MRRYLFALLLIAFAQVARGAPPREAAEIVIADFEGETYGNWKSTGNAFGRSPARGTLPAQMHVDGFKGKGLVNSFYGGDQSTGTLTSPPFTIERAFITFLIGGGNDKEKLGISLVVDGTPVRGATGPNDQPGGNETLAPEMWDVSEYSGKSAVIRVIDQAKGSWGHINVDQIVQTNRRLPLALTNATSAIKIEKRYLQLPIKNGATKRKVTFLIDGRAEVTNDIELANAAPDWWAFVDISAWKGKTLTVRVDKLAEDSQALGSIEQSDSIKDAGNLYREPLRGQFHFSSRRGWNNDPNGMVFYRGEYHLFYQHNPYGWSWGNMHWGHAVSKDMIHWRELGDALAPDRLGPMFSGSAVVDWTNTSGFGKDGQPPLILIYTAAGNPTTQCVAYSTDGRHFTKYHANPVLGQITGGNRDPKVMWHAPTQKWIMVLYVSFKGDHTIHFFTSPNLREWALASVAEARTMGKGGYLFECPDFFELAVAGAGNTKNWVLLAANTEYATGTFDGGTFTPEQSKLPGQRGQGFYAPQTFSDIPHEDGRRIQIGWFQTPTVGMPFNQSMTIPLELNLVSTADGPRMTWTPIKEMNSLRAKSHPFDALTLEAASANPLADLKAELIEMRAEFEPADATELAFTVRGAAVVYNVKRQELIVNNVKAPVPLRDGKQNLTIFCDRTGLEIFADHGLTYIPMPYQPRPGDLSLAIQAKGDRAKITKLAVHELTSAWLDEAGLDGGSFLGRGQIRGDRHVGKDIAARGKVRDKDPNRTRGRR